MRKITAAAVQMSVPDTREKSIEKADRLVCEAAARGANVILLPELFETWYFCQERRYDSYSLAAPLSENPAVNHFKAVAKELGAKKVVSRAERDGQAKFLLRNGADEIVYPEKQLADWTAIRYTADHILDYIELDSDYSIFEIAVPEKWIGKTVIEADVRKKHGINILAIKHGGKMDLDFAPQTSFREGDTILVLGDTKNIQRCFHI